MNKAIIPALAVSLLMFILMGLGGNNQEPAPVAAPAPAAPSMGVVRLQDVYAMSRVGKEAVQHLEKTQEAAVIRLTELHTQIEKAQADKDEAQEQRLQVELQGFTYSMQGMLNQEQERMVQLVSEKVTQGIDKYREDNGLDLIISNDYAQSFDPSLDVTDKVLVSIDAISFEIGEMPSLEAPQAPAMEAPLGPEPAPVTDNDSAPESDAGAAEEGQSAGE